jgi:ATP-dependent Clp protease adaptor protein ClpS
MVERVMTSISTLASQGAAPRAGKDDQNDTPGNGTGNGTDNGTGVGLATRTRPKTQKPSLYKVLMLNDDYTPMEFVVLTLQRFFRMSIEDATRVMLHVHQRGVGVCGIFTYEVAETKVNQVIDFAREHQHPLQCTMEKE